MIFTGGITLPSKELYGHSNSKSTSAFFKYFSSVVSLLNEGDHDDDHRRAKEIRDVINLERQLAGIMAREDNMTGIFVSIDKVQSLSENEATLSINPQNFTDRSILHSVPTGEAGRTFSTT